MKKIAIIGIMSVCATTFIHAQLIKINSLTGPDEVCPGTNGDGPSYEYHAESNVPGCFTWFVFEDGQWSNVVGAPCPCQGPSTSSDFTHEFNASEGNATVRVVFNASFGPLCSDSKTESMTVTKRTFGPGTPYDSDGGPLNICPGEVKTFSIPGVPVETNFPIDENCNWHHSWVYTAPQGWKVNGQTETITSIYSSVTVEAPLNIPVGNSGNFNFKVETGPNWSYFKEITVPIIIGQPDNLLISGVDLLCTSNATFNLENYAGGDVNWSVSPTSLFAVDTDTGSSFTTRATSSFTAGQGTITATISGDCGNATLQKSVWVGRPAGISFDYYPSLFGCTEGEIGVDNTVGGANTYTWNVSGGIITQFNSTSGTSSSPVIFLDPNDQSSSVTFNVKANNGCGSTFQISETVGVECTTGGPGGPCCATPLFVFNPNPVEDDLNVSITNIEELETHYEKSQFAYQVAVTDLTGDIKMRGALNKNGLSLNLEKLKTGVYIVKISNKEFEGSYRIIVE